MKIPWNLILTNADMKEKLDDRLVSFRKPL
jgi:hypothetical protein